MDGEVMTLNPLLLTPPSISTPLSPPPPLFPPPPQSNLCCLNQIYRAISTVDSCFHREPPTELPMPFSPLRYHFGPVRLSASRTSPK
jgi:hypothetical protein